MLLDTLCSQKLLPLSFGKARDINTNKDTSKTSYNSGHFPGGALWKCLSSSWKVRGQWKKSLSGKNGKVHPLRTFEKPSRLTHFSLTRSFGFSTIKCYPRSIIQVSSLTSCWQFTKSMTLRRMAWMQFLTQLWTTSGNWKRKVFGSTLLISKVL